MKKNFSKWQIEMDTECIERIRSHGMKMEVAIRAIRKFDCGAWLQAGETGNQKRIELMHLLDKLYASAGIVAK